MLYQNNSDNTARYLLGEPGKKNILVIGVNPSTATGEKDDQTVKRIKSITSSQGYDGWVLINLYPLRATSFEELPAVFDESMHQENLRIIGEAIPAINGYDIWAAWGGHIDKRSYLRPCLRDLATIIGGGGHKWLQADTLTNEGNPRHPLFLKGDVGFSEFNILNYLKA